MKYISLFSGIGGFDLALNRLGHECVYANEWDKYAAEIYNENFKLDKTQSAIYSKNGRGTIGTTSTGTAQSTIDTRDIRTVPTSEIPNHELLVGGFPCQAFSIAGKRRGFDDTRGTLFFEIARILKDKQPKFFILENVKGLLSHDGGFTFKTIISTLTELGYELQWQVLNSKNFGVPQNRERVFIVGHIRGESRPKVFPIRGVSSENNELVYYQKADREIARIYNTTGIAPTLHLKTGGWQEPKIALSLDANYYKGLSPSHSANRVDRNVLAIPVLTPDRPKKRQNGRRFKSNGEPSFTLTGQDKHGVSDGIRIRRLTPVECERLQGFPDGWTEGISDTQRYKCLGNAVTVNVVYEVARRLNGRPTE